MAATMTLHEAAELYELQNRTEGKSPRTVSWYNQVLLLFGRFLEESGRPAMLASVGEREVREFILHLQTKQKYADNPYFAERSEKLSAYTVQNRVRALKAFTAWLAREGYTSHDVLERVKTPKAPRKVAPVLTEEEIRRLLTCLNVRTAYGARDYAILVTFLDTGLRCSELTSLTLADLNLEGGYCKVMGKGAKERIVPFGATAQKAIFQYVRQFRPEPASHGIQEVLLTWDGRPLNLNSMKLILKRLGKTAGVPRLHPHLCRHTFATRYLINGGDVFSLQQILGHTTLEMVRRYVSLASAHVAVQHRKFSPMDLLQAPGKRPARSSRG
jgi:integrase/recombinase XerC/integrase/recombinase XerD